mgnify:CR=1 FL=1
MKLRLADGMIERDPAKAHALLAELQRESNEALEDLRDLARGIYPPLLADRGLAAALDAQARKASVPVTVDADGIGRFEPEVEAAVYFSCLEALQNVAKYADANAATILLVERFGRAPVRDPRRRAAGSTRPRGATGPVCRGSRTGSPPSAASWS